MFGVIPSARQDRRVSERWADPAQWWGLTRPAVEKTKDSVPSTTYREAKRSVRVLWAVRDGLT